MKFGFMKGLESLGERIENIRRAFYDKFERPNNTPMAAAPSNVWVRDVYETFLIADVDDKNYRVGYSVDEEGNVQLAEMGEWVEVEQIWQTTRSIGAAQLKSLDEQTAIVAGYGVVFGGKDLTGETFTEETDYLLDYVPIKMVFYDHNRDKAIRHEIGAVLKTVQDEVGIWVEAQLDRSKEYVDAVLELVEKGALGWSSGCMQQKMVREASVIKSWPIVEFSLTPTPAEPRTLGVQRLKSISTPGKSGSKGGAQTGGHAGRTPGANNKSYSGRNTMKDVLLESIQKLVPGLTDEQCEGIGAVLGLAGIQPAAGEPGEGGDGGTTRSIDEKQLIAQLKAIGIQVPDAQQRNSAITRPPYSFKAAGDEPESDEATKAINSFYQTRFGDEKAAEKAIFEGAIGKDYRKTIIEQDAAFGKYLKYGPDRLSGTEKSVLSKQIYPLDGILSMVKGGMSVDDVKTTMVEAQGELGGYAIPPNRQSEITSRMRGLTVVRANGANVVQLQKGNSIEIPQLQNNDTTGRYPSHLRGAWGDETQTPTEKNAKLKYIDLIAHIYTYKVSFSRSLVEDAANFVSKVLEAISDTLAIDEDEAFLVGDGIGKPLGILPGEDNTLSLSEVVSGNASAVTANGIRHLKRGLFAQYRTRGIFIANSDTYQDIEDLVDGNGNYLFPQLTDADQLLRRKAAESEAMPDVAADAYPMIFGDMSGYSIVERLGMTIERFHDSGTGVNKVEYQVRRRLGGRVEKSWCFCVHKISAS